MSKQDKKRKKRIWQVILVVSLVLELALIAVSVVARVRGAAFPTWQILIFVGIAVWIYIAFLKQRSIDISRTVVEEKVKTHTLADHLREGILIIDQDGQLLLVNQRAAKVLGVDELDILGKRLAELVDASGRELLEGEQSGEVTAAFEPTGTSVHFSAVAMASNQDGERNTIVYVRDAQAEAVAEKDDANVCETGGAAGVLEELSEYLCSLGSESARAGFVCGLLGQEMRMSGGAAASAAPLKVGDLTKTTVDGMRGQFESDGVQLEESYNDEEISFAGDQSQIRLALAQVIGNALLASTKGNTVKVQTAAMGNHSGIAVTDMRSLEGVDDVSELFASDYSSIRGTGYGAARRVVEACGGTMTAEKGADGGVRITTMLPSA